MTILEAFILGLVQGFTEFLPVSSSGHLVLAQHALDLRGELLSFDIFVHFGTLLSVVLYFWKDILAVAVSTTRATFSMHWKKAFRDDENARMGFALIVATIPAGAVGLLYRDAIEAAFADPKLVAMNLVITGLILFLTRLARSNPAKRIGIVSGFLIGIAQAFAILPGISRSGSTISSALYLKITPVQAARFSFLMSIPVIGGASLLETMKIVKHGTDAGLLPLAVGTLAAALSGYVSIKLMLNIVQRGKLNWFALYCLVVGVLGILFIN